MKNIKKKIVALFIVAAGWLSSVKKDEYKEGDNTGGNKMCKLSATNLNISPSKINI